MNFEFLIPLKKIPYKNFNQRIGRYNMDTKCGCFGAHLAFILKNELNYKIGRNEFCRLAGINRAQIILLFRKAGLTVTPFGAEKWNLPVLEVIRNLEKIKKPPLTKNMNLRAEDFEKADFEKADFENTNFFKANLSEAVLRLANLKYANLEQAQLFMANLEKANLFEANLFEAILYKANLSQAYLSNANIHKANLYRANLSLANLHSANLSLANLHSVNFEGAVMKDCKFPKQYIDLLSLKQASEVMFV